jgi:hypothetical protein
MHAYTIYLRRGHGDLGASAKGDAMYQTILIAVLLLGGCESIGMSEHVGHVETDGGIDPCADVVCDPTSVVADPCCNVAPPASPRTLNVSAAAFTGAVIERGPVRATPTGATSVMSMSLPLDAGQRFGGLIVACQPLIPNTTPLVSFAVIRTAASGIDAILNEIVLVLPDLPWQTLSLPDAAPRALLAGEAITLFVDSLSGELTCGDVQAWHD